MKNVQQKETSADPPIRLVASDMDGTLLGADGKVSERNAKSIRALQQKGVVFLVCTGRAYQDAARPLKEKGISCPIVCMNGAAIYNEDGTLAGQRPLEEDQVRQILASCSQETEICFDFMTDRGSVTISSEELFSRYYHENILLPMVGKTSYEKIHAQFRFICPEELFSQGFIFYKISMIHPDPRVLRKVRERLGGCPELAVAASHYTNLEITHAKAQKGVALLHYAQIHGIRPREMMALGDSENDASMLSLPLGYTLAMENGMDSIKRIARCQTRSNVQDGVAFAIETLVV